MTRKTLKYFLQGLSSVLFAIAGLSFLVGGRVLMAFWKVDFVLAEFLGIACAALCIGIALVAKSKIEDLEWEEQNEAAEEQKSEFQDKVLR